MITMPIELYTDGSSSKDPSSYGSSGLAYIIRYWTTPEIEDGLPESHEIEGSQGFKLSTSNRMEISAGIYGLNTIIDNIINGTLQGASQINAFSDSEYFCNAINQRWINKWMENNWMTSGFKTKQPQPVKNKDLWEQVVAIQNKLQSMGIIFTITHINGHVGHEFNERADKLAVAASHSTDKIVDEEYEKIIKSLNNYRR